MNAPDSWSTLVCRAVTRTQIAQFAGASAEFSELHIDEQGARERGHPSVMAHGMWCAALTVRAVTDRFGSGAVRDLEVRYSAPAWPGDSLTAHGVVTGEERGHLIVDVKLTSQTGTTVLTGTARVRPTAAEADQS